MYHYIEDDNDQKLNILLDYLHDVHNSRPIGFDTETTDLDPYKALPLLLQLNAEDNIYILDLTKLSKDTITKIVKSMNSGRLLLAHNAKFDIKILYHNYGVLLNNIHDTMWAETLIYQGVGEVLHSLSKLVLKYCGVILDKSEQSSFITSEGKPISSEQLAYAAKDVLYLESIYYKQIEMIKQAKELKVWELESKLVPVIAKMEYKGIMIDQAAWLDILSENEEIKNALAKELPEFLVDKLKLSKYKNALKAFEALCIPAKLKRDITTLESIIGEAGIREAILSRLNLNSPKQLLTILNAAGIKVKNTNEKTLKSVKDSPEVAKLLEYREVEKKITTYGVSFLRDVNPVTNRIHTEYLNLGAATGRLSSTKPNMQNIPRDSRYRECFVAAPGNSLIAVDYSQQEFRLAGALSDEDIIIDAYIAGKDMHTATASIMFGVPLDQVTKEQRQFGKTLNFAILYGSTEKGLAYNMGISTQKGIEIINTFKAGYPKLAAFKNAVEEMVIKLGYSVTPLGRRRYFPELGVFASPEDIYESNMKRRKEGFNHVIQGGGADITKLALTTLEVENPFGDRFNILLQVHDEIVAEADDSIVEEAFEFMKEVMVKVEQPFLGRLPAEVDGKISKVWTH